MTELSHPSGAELRLSQDAEQSAALHRSSLSIIIVNWNTGDLLRECLQSITDAIAKSIDLREVVVVDNASNDGSIIGCEALSLQLVMLRNDVNCGFAAACNQGARLATGEFLLFLNPDTRLFEESLRVPLEFLRCRDAATVGICGIRLLNDLGDEARHCARFPRLSHFFCEALGVDRVFPGPLTCHLMKEWDHLSDREVDQVIGAFFLVRHSLYLALGGFDERFFVYFEEVDFALRARRAGWITAYLAGAMAYHKGNGSTAKIASRRLFYSMRSRILYARKHWPFIRTLGLLGVTLIIEPVTRLSLTLCRGSLEDFRNSLAGYGMLYGNLPRILFARYSYADKPLDETAAAKTSEGADPS